MVPGGVGRRYPEYADPVIAFIRQVFPRLRYLLTVCTGSALAAQAGVLDGKRATSNKLNWELVTALTDRVDWVRQARWVADGNCWTASGVSAGMDATLAFVEAVYGRPVAQTIAERMEYIRNEQWDQDPFC